MADPDRVNSNSVIERGSGGATSQKDTVTKEPKPVAAAAGTSTPVPSGKVHKYNTLAEFVNLKNGGTNNWAQDLQLNQTKQMPGSNWYARRNADGSVDAWQGSGGSAPAAPVASAATQETPAAPVAPAATQETPAASGAAPTADAIETPTTTPDTTGIDPEMLQKVQTWLAQADAAAPNFMKALRQVLGAGGGTAPTNTGSGTSGSGNVVANTQQQQYPTGTTFWDMMSGLIRGATPNPYLNAARQQRKAAQAGSKIGNENLRQEAQRKWHDMTGRNDIVDSTLRESVTFGAPKFKGKWYFDPKTHEWVKEGTEVNKAVVAASGGPGKSGGAYTNSNIGQYSAPSTTFTGSVVNRAGQNAK
jgi:hypothetical protein